MKFRERVMCCSLVFALFAANGCASSDGSNSPSADSGGSPNGGLGAGGIYAGGAVNGGVQGTGGAAGGVPGVGGTMPSSGGLPPITGGVGPGAGGGSPGGPPNVAQFSATPQSITQGQSVTFNVLVTDPDGSADIVGGTLTDQTGAVTYGNFTSQGGGAFTFTTDWIALNAIAPIEFTGQGTRMLKARFIDQAGHTGERTVTLAFTCPGGGACAGACVNLMTDGNHCGSCAKKCRSATGCVSGACGPSMSSCFSVNAGYTTCDQACTAISEACVVAACTDLKVTLMTFPDMTCSGPFVTPNVGCGDAIPWTGRLGGECCCTDTH